MQTAGIQRHFIRIALALTLASAAFYLLPPSALAADFIPVNDNSDGPISASDRRAYRRVEIISAKECFAALQPITIPFDIFREGLDALVETTIGHERDLACVSTALSAWSEFAVSEVVPKAKAEPAPAYIPSALNISRQAALEEKLQCFNPAAAGSAEFQAYASLHQNSCAGQWLSADEAAPLQKELAKEAKKNAILLALQNKENLVSVLQLAWQGSLQDKITFANGKTAKEMSKCFSNEPPTSIAYAAQLKEYPHCGEKLIPLSDAQSYANEWGKLGAPFFKKAQALNPFLSELNAANPRALVFELASKVACFSEYAAGSEEAEIFRKLMASRCGSFGIKPVAELEAYSAKLVSETDKLIPELEKWMQKDAAMKAAEADEYERLNPHRYRDYNTRRLLARLQFHLSHGGKASELYAFCQAFEEDQQRDLRYAKESLYFNAYTREQDWSLAATYGYTEGELSALLSYTGSYYQTINQALWTKPVGDSLSPKLATFQKHLEKALSRTPEYAGALRRFSELPASVLAQHQEGAIVSYAAYTSTSADPNWDWAGGMSGIAHSFTILGRHGKDLNDISPMKNEKEVLFRAGARFKVLSRKERPTVPGAYDFVMAEVDEAGNVIADLPPELAGAKEAK